MILYWKKSPQVVALIKLLRVFPTTLPPKVISTKEPFWNTLLDKINVLKSELLPR